MMYIEYMLESETKHSQIKCIILMGRNEKLCFFEYFNVSLVGEFA